MKKVLGYELYAQKESGFMLSEDDFEVCNSCNFNINPNYYNPNFKKKMTHDIEDTYDSYVIVSQKFKDFCTRNQYKNLSFRKLNLMPNYYVFNCLDVVDVVESEFELNDLCLSCGWYRDREQVG